MNIDWHSNGFKRLCTSIVIVAVLASAFALRLLTIWIFDIFVLALMFVAVRDILRAKQNTKPLGTVEGKPVKAGEQKKLLVSTAVNGVSIFYLYTYIFVAYMVYMFGIVSEFSWWLHVVLQAVILFIMSLYVMLMNYTDKSFAKECNSKKEPLGKTAAKSVLEFLKIILYPCVLLFCLILINHMDSAANVIMSDTEVSVPLLAFMGLVLIFVISCFTDTFAYLVGMTLKGPKLLPAKLRYISPKKSIAGTIGGLFGGMVGALLTLLIFVRNASPLQAFLTETIGDTVAVQFVFLFIGLVGSVISQIGDLYASWIKRKTEIKDFGRYLPGHGGIMDRLDGVSFNSLFIYLTLLFMVLL